MLPARIAFNSEGTFLAVLIIPGEASADPSTITMFDVETGDVIFEEQEESMRTLAFSPDGTLLLIANRDEVIFLAAG